jgi:hypothetical protein
VNHYLGDDQPLRLKEACDIVLHGDSHDRR